MPLSTRYHHEPLTHYSHEHVTLGGPREDLDRYRHHIAAEREHGLDHLIADMTTHYPSDAEHEVTGYVHDSHYHHLQNFYDEHADEIYGDESHEGKAHLHLHPTHKAHHYGRVVEHE